MAGHRKVSNPVVNYLSIPGLRMLLNLFMISYIRVKHVRTQLEFRKYSLDDVKRQMYFCKARNNKTVAEQWI